MKPITVTLTLAPEEGWHDDRYDALDSLDVALTDAMTEPDEPLDLRGFTIQRFTIEA